MRYRYIRVAQVLSVEQYHHRRYEVGPPVGRLDFINLRRTRRCRQTRQRQYGNNKGKDDASAGSAREFWLGHGSSLVALSWANQAGLPKQRWYLNGNCWANQFQPFPVAQSLADGCQARVRVPVRNLLPDVRCSG